MKSRIIEVQPIDQWCEVRSILYHVQFKRRPWWWFQKIWLTEKVLSWEAMQPLEFASIEKAEAYIERRKTLKPQSNVYRKVKRSERTKSDG